MLEDATATVLRAASPPFLHLGMTACTCAQKLSVSRSLDFSPDTSHMSYVSNI